ncbi:hypothetical protein FSARC_602 [Fusarium sarcochroum]|uniref:Uncharacterized protein n=1 Tax=Fusarium sarcochroum TaxID=1208366 RepID=A0A8H4XFZ9_9HYPO|nr:hypothetical protein FSARC_602 [Fusarium sarcochroum]
MAMLTTPASRIASARRNLAREPSLSQATSSSHLPSGQELPLRHLVAIFWTLWPADFSKPRYSLKLDLYFDGRVYHRAVRVQILWNFPSSHETKPSYSSLTSVLPRPTDSSNDVSTQPAPPYSVAGLPMICYIDKSQLASDRANRRTVTPGPVSRLLQRKGRMLIPVNSDHGPYFVDILLGMAQKHFYPTPPNTCWREPGIFNSEKGIPPRPEFQDLKLRIIAHDMDAGVHHLYGAPPNDDDAAVSGLKIEDARVPTWPIPNLQERLGKALGQIFLVLPT